MRTWLRLVLAGIALGIAVSLLLGRVIGTQLVDVTAPTLRRGKRFRRRACHTRSAFGISRIVGSLFVAEIWRYPVKSMAGEALGDAEIGLAGIAGDRVVQVFNGQGRVVTARTHPALLSHRATLDSDGEPLVDGRPWSDATILADVRRIVGPDARLVRDPDLDVRFDVLPLLVATDGAIAAFGRDRRRLRPNLVIGGVSGLDERRWPGRHLRIGDVVIAVDSLRGRCVMTTFDPDSLQQDPHVLRDIVQRFGGRLALNCDVVRGGTIRVGQAVEFVEVTAPEALSHQAARQHLKTTKETA